MERITLRVTQEQKDEVEQRAKDFGFVSVSNYIRFILLMEMNFMERVEEIHKEVCQNASEDYEETKIKNN